METKLLWFYTLICKFPSVCRHMQLKHITLIINFLWYFIYAVVCSVFIVAGMTDKLSYLEYEIWPFFLSRCDLFIIHFLQSSQRSSLPCSTLSPHMAHTIAFSSSFSVNSFLRIVHFGTLVSSSCSDFSCPRFLWFFS
jgi:hypothetical protein